MLSNKLEITDESQTELENLYDNDLNEFTVRIREIMRKYPTEFNFLSMGSSANGTGIDEKVFSEHVSMFRPELRKKIFFAIMKHRKKEKKGKITYVDVQSFIGNRKKHKEVNVSRDIKWVLEKLKATDAHILDTNHDHKITKEEFNKYFERYKVASELLDKIFDLVDDNKDGTISLREFYNFRAKFMKHEYDNLMENDEPRSPPSMVISSSEEFSPLHSPETTPPPFGFNSSESNQSNDGIQKDKQFQDNQNPIETDIKISDKSTIEDNHNKKISQQNLMNLGMFDEDISINKMDDKIDVKQNQVPNTDPILENLQLQIKIQPEDKSMQKNEETIIVEKDKNQSDGENHKDKDKDAKKQEQAHPEKEKNYANEYTVAEIQIPNNIQREITRDSSLTGAQGLVLLRKQSTIPTKESNKGRDTKPELSAQEISTSENVQLDINKPIKRLWVKAKSSKVWRECIILDEKENEILVHYISYHSKYDEWIKKSEKGTRWTDKIPNNTLNIGDNISVYATDVNLWVEAEIKEIDYNKNKIKILYVGVNNHETIDANSPRISKEHKLANALLLSKNNQYELVNQNRQGAKGCCNIL